MTVRAVSVDRRVAWLNHKTRIQGDPLGKRARSFRFYAGHVTAGETGQVDMAGVSCQVIDRSPSIDVSMSDQSYLL